MARFSVGSLVKCRGRSWVVLPSEHEYLMNLRPIGGTELEECSIFLPLEGHLSPASFPYPDPGSAGDFVSGRLLRNATRLSFRNGAGPFRSLGRLYVRPRPYQLVPLIMALRLNPVRLLIADDVGVGKTIEAGVIVRELFDRGEIRRLTVLCPPNLCDQWQRELRDKFALDAVIVRSNTISRLDRGIPHTGMSIFEYYPITVASIDYVKSERHRDDFLRACPSCVIVDEAHTATTPRGGGVGRQQRYDLVRQVADDSDRHLLLLTATPHSGIEDSFQSLLALLNPEFAELDLTQLGEGDRKKLAQYFIQRRRADVLRWLGEETPFPSRESKEVGYAMPLSSPYRKLFDDVFAFARERITEQDADAPAHRQRVRYWAALALLRCIMSSPAAAEKALRSRASSVSDKQHAPDETESMAWLTGDENEDEVDNLLGGYVYDATDQDGAQDTEPSHMVEHGSSRSERDRLRRFAARAAALVGDDDPKLQATLKLVESLLKDGYSPIIYCRYIATAGYLADHIKARITRYGNDLRVLAITGERSEDEREMLVEELCEYPQRVLVATDCLSEGINLQHAFDAVVHYDLPWNPNRLEQREGRVDRYGQRKLKVRTSLIASQDNPMDEAVMKVLLRKAIEIHRTLGISVPLPTSSKEVLDTLIGDLFFQGKEQTSFLEQAKQMMIGEDGESSGLEQRWKQVVDRERQSRTRFAQQRIKPEEVARELEESDAVLGDVVTVASFVRDACERLGGVLIPESARSLAGVDRLALGGLPQAVRERVQPAFAPRPGAALPETVWITFSDPAPSAEVHVVGRNHPLTVALADYLMGMALTWDDSQDLPPASRCSVIRSRAVQERTVLLVLRVRMMLQSSGRGGKDVPSILAEEVVVTGYRGSPSQVCWLEESEALKLLQQEVLPDQNVQQEEKRLTLERAIEQVQQMEAELVRLAEERASRLQESHQRVRRATGQGATRVSPADAPDVLGVYVITPPLPAGS